MFTPAHDKEKDWIYQGKELPPLHEDTVVVAKSKKRVADHVELGPGPSGGHHGQLERHTQVVQKNNYRHARRLHPSLVLTGDVHEMKTLGTRLGVKIPVVSHVGSLLEFDSYSWKTHASVRRGEVHVARLITKEHCKVITDAVERAAGKPKDWPESFGLLQDLNVPSVYNNSRMLDVEIALSKGVSPEALSLLENMKKKIEQMQFEFENNQDFRAGWATITIFCNLKQGKAQVPHLDVQTTGGSSAEEWKYHQKNVMLWVALEEGCRLGIAPAGVRSDDQNASPEKHVVGALYALEVPMGCAVVVSATHTWHFGTGATTKRMAIHLRSTHNLGGREIKLKD